MTEKGSAIAAAVGSLTASALVVALVSACGSHASVPPPPMHSGQYDASSYPPPSGAVLKGNESMAAGDLDAAQNSYQAQLGSNPFDPVALNNLAVAKSEEGQYDQARQLLERASTLAPDNAEIAANLSRLRAYQNSYAIPENQTGDSTVTGAPALPAGIPPEPPALWQPLPTGQVSRPVQQVPARRASYGRSTSGARTATGPYYDSCSGKGFVTPPAPGQPLAACVPAPQ